MVINRKLNWREHLKQVQKKVVKISGRISTLVANTWGLKSEAVETIYKRAVEPMILYAAELWGQALERQWAKAALVKLQRSVLLRICKAYRTVSSDALQIITGIMPMDLKAMMAIKISTVKREQQGTPFTLAKKRVVEEFQEKWNQRWQQSTKGRVTTEFFPTVNSRMAIKDMAQCFAATQFMTGHGKFGDYLQRRSIRETSSCRCGVIQCPPHLLFECDLLEQERRSTKTRIEALGVLFDKDQLHHIIANTSAREELFRLIKLIHQKLIEWENNPL